MTTPEKKISAFAELESIAEDGVIIANQTATGPTGKLPVPTLRTRLNTGNQTFDGDVDVTGKVSATQLEGNGALISGVVSAGTGGTSSTGSLQLVANSDNSTPLAKIQGSKYSTPLFDFDENGLELKTGIPYSHQDDAIPFDKDIDLSGNRMSRNQTFQDIQPFQSMHFEGNDYAYCADDIEFNPGTNSYSYGIRFRLAELSGDQYLVHKITSPASHYLYTDTSGIVRCYLSDGVANTTKTLDQTLDIDKWYKIIVVIDRINNLLKFYISGWEDQTVNDISAITGSVNAPTFFVLGSAGGGSGFLVGDECEFFNANYALTDAQAKSLSGSPFLPFDWRDEYGSNTAYTSGTLIKGKRYRTDLFVAGDDFSNIADIGAAANVTGARWIATGTTPTTWTNSTEIIKEGVTVHLKPRDIVSDKNGNGIYWKDSHPSANHLLVSGTTVGNRSNEEQKEQGTWAPANGDFGTWTTPSFTATYTKYAGQATVTLKQTAGTIDPGAAGKYITGVPFTPSAIASGQATSTAHADNGAIHLQTDGKLYFVNDIGAVTDLEFSITYLTED